jgi:hypothetical protein
MINVYANYFYEKNDIRRLELEECIINNYNNSLINYTLIESDKKMSFKNFFDIINNITTDDDINIICNLDIYFNETINYVNSITKDQFFALSRYDIYNNQLKLFDAACSQDTWIWKGKSKNINSDYLMGMPGCDNRLAYEAQAAGYQVSNPSKTIQTIHVHKSNIRNYTPGALADTVPPPYHTISPHHL